MQTNLPTTGMRRAIALVLLLAAVTAMLAPLLMLAQSGGSHATDAGAANTGAASAADHWAPVVSSALVQLGGIVAHRGQLARLRARVGRLEHATRPVLEWWGTRAAPAGPRLTPAIAMDAVAARGAA